MMGAMYAIIRSGGKQLRVTPGEVVRVERLAAEPGTPVVFDEVLLVHDGGGLRVGRPTVAGCRVRGTALAQGRGEKLLIYTYKRRQNSNRRRRGHRQAYTAVRIESIEG